MFFFTYGIIIMFIFAFLIIGSTFVSFNTALIHPCILDEGLQALRLTPVKGRRFSELVP